MWFYTTPGFVPVAAGSPVQWALMSVGMSVPLYSCAKHVVKYVLAFQIQLKIGTVPQVSSAGALYLRVPSSAIVLCHVIAVAVISETVFRSSTLDVRLGTTDVQYCNSTSQFESTEHMRNGGEGLASPPNACFACLTLWNGQTRSPT